jgi:hypothetical protein
MSTTTTTLPRSQEQIAARIESIKADDFFGFRREVLLGSLDFEHARPFLKAEATVEAWEEEPAETTVESVLQSATKYLDFAFGKALDHRGISAGRSVEKMTEYAWLLGDDALAERMGGHYAQYGMPALLAFAERFDLPIPEDERVERMGQGLKCRPDCDEGCGR